MKASIGRIVIYHCTEEEKKVNNFQETAPAIITTAWSDTCVNLRVILDSDKTLWKTSAPLGDLENQWSWPVIN